MYSIIKTILDVDHFSVGKNYYCYFLKTQELVVNENIFKISNENIWGAYLSESNILYVTTDSQKYYYHISNDIQLLFKSTHLTGLRLLRDENSYFLSISENLEFELYDLEQRIVIQKFKTKYSDYEPLVFNNNTIYIHLFPENRIKSINLETGTYNWEVDLGVYISSVLGVFANKLWIYTGTNELISLALNTGQILQRIRSHDFHPNVSDSGFVAYAVHFEEEQGRITFLEHRTYVEFDLASCQVIRQKSFDTGNPQTDWAFSVNSLDDNYCYFVGNQGRDAGFAQWVGVLNRTTLEVGWSEHLGKLNPKNYWALNKAPLSDGNKLYVHDSEGTLHIFEKTEEN